MPSPTEQVYPTRLSESEALARVLSNWQLRAENAEAAHLVQSEDNARLRAETEHLRRQLEDARGQRENQWALHLMAKERVDQAIVLLREAMQKIPVGDNRPSDCELVTRIAVFLDGEPETPETDLVYERYGADWGWFRADMTGPRR